MKTPFVVMIGLDAADPRLLQRFMQSGIMPNLKSVRDRGRWGELRTPEGLGDDATWASFSTGVGPGRHGRFFHRQPTSGTYSSRSFREADFGAEPFWSLLGRQGMRVAVLDVPKSPLPEGLNGIQLSDWRVHGRDGSTRSWPREMARDVIERFGDDDTDQEPEYLCLMDSLPRATLASFIDRLLYSIDQKLAFAKEAIRLEDWDLFLVVFKEAHCIGHQCWHLVDQSHPEYDPRLREELEQPVERIYAALDRALGDLLAEVPEDACVVVFSSLGMDQNTTGEHMLESILLRLEPSVLWSVWSRMYDLQYRYRSARLRRYLNGVHRRLMRYRTAFHVEHNELSGAVRLNLVGREPQGKVLPEERESALERLEKELLSLVESGSGRPAVTKVVRTDREFAGSGSDRLADLLVEWSRDLPPTFEAVHSASVGRLHVSSPYWRPGNHVSGGVYYAAGPQISAASAAAPASITDLAPTVASLLGCDLLGAVEGEPIGSLLSAVGGSTRG